jgi:hypothetical protein
MTDIVIDTTDQTETKLVAGIATLRTAVTPRLKLFLKADDTVRDWMIANDPLTKATLKLGRDLVDYIKKVKDGGSLGT